MHLAGQQRIKSARENRALLSAAAHVLCMHGIVLVLAGRRALLGHSPVTPCTGVGGFRQPWRARAGYMHTNIALSDQDRLSHTVLNGNLLLPLKSVPVTVSHTSDKSIRCLTSTVCAGT